VSQLLGHDTIEATCKHSDWSEECFARRMLEVLGELFGNYVRLLLRENFESFLTSPNLESEKQSSEQL
jgi:hypothetical protein